MATSAPAATEPEVDPLPGWREAVARLELRLDRAEARLRPVLEQLSVPDLLAP